VPRVNAALRIFLVGTSCCLAAEPPDPPEAAYPALERFVETLEAVRARHPETDRLAYERLVNHALDGMLSSLDPHSSFIHPEMNAHLAQGVDPEIPSLGMTLEWIDGEPRVAAVAAGGAAAEAGISAGAKLLEIDSQPLAGISPADLAAILRRPAGAVTSLLYQNPGGREPAKGECVHRVVETRSVTEARLLQKEVGYIRLAQFGRGCAREMETALDDLENGGMKSLILDLRGNGGGDLHETVKILGFFLPPGTEVVTVRGRDAENDESLKTPERQRRERKYPLVVLQDRDSASASELTAGALQDTGRAKVVGERSYGKGSVQHIVPMGGGTALRLTVATYHTPSGATPHRKGVTPDEVVEIDEEARANAAKIRRTDTLPPAERERLAKWADPVIGAALARLARPEGPQ
jgi:carboxyl-terminal processing protease